MTEIKTLLRGHWDDVKRIYEEGIATRNATFETSAPSWEVWDSGHLASGRLVALDEDIVTGWAALSPVSDRCAYAGVAEVSVYVSKDYRGKKIGSLLLERLIQESEKAGLWTLQAGIFPENLESIALHEKNGFVLIGKRQKIGKMDNVWRDSLILERRSRIVGL